MLPPQDSDLNPAEIHDKQVQTFFDETIRLMQQILHLLTLTLDAWETFSDGDIGYFSNLEATNDKSFLLAIDKHMSELGDLRKSVSNQRDLLQSLSRKVRMPPLVDQLSKSKILSSGGMHKILIKFQLELRLQLDNNIVASHQQQSAEHVKAFTIAALVSQCIRSIDNFDAYR